MKNKSNSIGFFQRTFHLIKGLFDKRTPWGPKLLGVLIIAYIILPFDFLSDLVPVLGWLDDAALAALGIFIISKLIPKEVLEDVTKDKDKQL